MTNLKAIVLDLDGTLLNMQGEISEETKRFLMELKERGIKIILATGRPINLTVPFHEELELETPMICLNGAVVYDRLENRIVSHESLSPYEVEDCYQIVEDDAKLLVCHTTYLNYQMINEQDYQVDYFQMEEQGLIPDENEPILKLTVFWKNRGIAEQVMKELSPYFEVNDWGDSFEVTNKGITKWYSLQRVLQQLHIQVKDVISFGDGPNDIEMIKNTGVGVAMENAIPELKAVSDFLTTSNEDNGISYFIERFYLNKSLLYK